MARARLVKPGLFANEVLGKLPVGARYLFVGLWTIADREGRLEDRPLRIAAELLPYDKKISVDDMLAKLTEAGFIERYSVSGNGYIQILSFAKHQSPHPKEQPSRIPPIEDSVACLEQVIGMSPASREKEMTSPSVAGSSGSSVAIAVAGSSVAEAVAVSADEDPPAADAPSKRKRPERRRLLDEAAIAEAQARPENWYTDVAAVARDYLNWRGSDGHKDQVQGLENQLEIPGKRQRFPRKGIPPPGAEFSPPEALPGEPPAYVQALRRMVREGVASNMSYARELLTVAQFQAAPEEETA